VALQTQIQVEGLRELQRALRQAADTELPKELRQVNKQVAERVVSAALTRVPRRTGRLAASIKPVGSNLSASVKAGGARVPYAAAIHWGWRKRNIAPRPFLVDAADAVARDVADAYVKALDRLLDRIRI
jgi:phage gpG-like protein